MKTISHSINEICYKCGYIIPRITLCPYCRFYNKISEEGRKKRMLLDWPIKPKKSVLKGSVLKKENQLREKKCLTCGNTYMGNPRHSYCSQDCRTKKFYLPSSCQHIERKKWIEEFLGLK